MKRYLNFISEEARLRDNRAVSRDKISEIETKAEREKSIRIDDPMQSGPLIGRISGLINQSRELVFSGLNRSEQDEIVKKLQDLAIDVIMNEYGDILGDVNLDIRMVPYGQVSNEVPSIRGVRQQPPHRREASRMASEIPSEETPEETQTPPDQSDRKKSFLSGLLGGGSGKAKKPEKPDWTTTQEFKSGVEVTKLINAIAQGEAKNTKHIIHSDYVKGKLEEIFGSKWNQIFRAWDEITKIADKLDWILPIEHRSELLSADQQNLGGAVQVTWDVNEEEEEEVSKRSEDILKKIEEGGDLDDEEIGDELEDLFAMTDNKPKITAVGVDFPMLIHETVKGIYQLIGSAWFPSGDAGETEIKKAELIKSMTSSFEDEVEDQRYGPYLAGELRDFVNSCPGIDKYPNIREYLWGDMCYMARTEVGRLEFLEIFKGILEKTPEAKRKVTKMIDNIIKRLDDYESEVNRSNIDFEYSDDEYSDTDDISTPDVPVRGYSDMSRRELQEMIDDILDSGINTEDDRKKISELTKELDKRG
jgi:hypothetical protein